MIQLNSMPEWMPDIATLYAAWLATPLARPAAAGPRVPDDVVGQRKHWAARAFGEYVKRK